MHSTVLPYRWVFRRFWWIFVAVCALGAVLVPALDSSKDRTYEATSLIVAQRFSQSVVALPKYGQTIFSEGDVGDQVASRLGISRQGLIPAKLSADTPQDSLVFSVTGRDADPRQAASLSNAGAEVFVAELNKGGSTVGVFAVQSQARVPSSPVSPRLGASVAVTIGLVAGAIFGLGVLMLIVLLRRPLVTPSDVTDQLELPGLGVLTLPPKRDTEPTLPEDAPGGTRVTRQVLAADVPTVLVVAAAADAAARQQTAQVLAMAIAFTGPVVYLGEPEAERDVNLLIRQRAVNWPEDEEVAGTRIVVVDVFNQPLRTISNFI